MKRQPELIRRRPAAVGDADRLHVLGAIAVGDLTILVALDHGRGCMCHLFLAERGYRGSQGETTGQRGAAFKEFSSSRSFRTHRCLLQMSQPGNRFPQSREYTLVSASNRAFVGLIS